MRKTSIALSALAVVLIAARLALPGFLLRQTNKKLATLEDYTGHVGDLDLALWRGAFYFHDVALRHRSGDLDLHIDALDLSIHWPHLFHRALVCRIKLTRPTTILVLSEPSKATAKAKEKGKEVEKTVEKKTGKTIAQVIRDLIPFRVDRFEIVGGTFSLRENAQHAAKRREDDAPKQAPLLTDFNLTVANLTNSSKLSTSLVSTCNVDSKIAGTGRMKIDLKINPVAQRPQFEMALTIEKFELPSIDQLLEWQTGLIFKHGTFALYSEASAADGGFKGYVKPFVENLKVETPPDKRSAYQKIKKGVINIAAKIFGNNDTKNVATRIPFEGRFENPDTDIWEAVVTLLRNAFIQALQPSLDRAS